EQRRPRARSAAWAPRGDGWRESSRRARIRPRLTRGASGVGSSEIEGAGKSGSDPLRTFRVKRGVESEAERSADEQRVGVDRRAQVGITKDVVSECKLRAEVRVPIFAEYANVLGEHPRNTRSQLHADSGIRGGLI